MSSYAPVIHISYLFIYFYLIENATKYRGYITPELWNYWYYNITYHELPQGSYLVFSTAATKEGANPPGMIRIYIHNTLCLTKL